MSSVRVQYSDVYDTVDEGAGNVSAMEDCTHQVQYGRNYHGMIHLYRLRTNRSAERVSNVNGAVVESHEQSTNYRQY
jgi:hypothetical protein